MFAITYAAALTSVFFGVTAAAFLITGRGGNLARVIWLYVAASSIWIGGNAMADISYTEEILRVASGLSFSGGAASMFLFLILVDRLIDEHFPSMGRMFAYGLVPFISSLFAFSSFAIVETRFFPNEPAQIIPGPLYSIALVFFLLSFAYGLFRLIYGIRHEAGHRKRMQLLYVLSGLLLTLLGELIFTTLLPLMGELRFYSLGPLFSLFFALAMFYAIARHRLLDISLVVQRGAIYTILVTLIIGLYAILLNAATLFFHSSPLFALYASAAVTTVLGIFGAPRIDRLLRRLTDPFFFKDHCDYAAAMHTLSESVSTAMTFDDIAREVEATLSQVLRAEYAAISFTADDANEPALSLPTNGLSMPVILGEARIAVITVGPKRSGDPYEREDERLLATFANHTASALARVNLYRRIEAHAEELEAKVLERTERIASMREAEKQLMLDISHNLQTPLAIFQTKLDQAKRTPTHTLDFTALERSLSDLSNFIYTLLTLAKRESEGALLESSTVNLTQLLAELVEELEVIAAARDVRIFAEVKPDLLVQGDAARIREAIMNCADNALSYLCEDGERTVSIRAFRSDSTIHIEITDTGIGISDSDLPRLFERFYRGANARSRAGTGLGLASAKQIVEQHGGIIAAKSVLGSGTTITVLLPATERKD